MDPGLRMSRTFTKTEIVHISWGRHGRREGGNTMPDTESAARPDPSCDGGPSEGLFFAMKPGKHVLSTCL